MNQQTVPHDIIMRGRMFLKPNRLMSSWTGNSAVKKHSNWIVVPWTGVALAGHLCYKRKKDTYVVVVVGCHIQIIQQIIRQRVREIAAIQLQTEELWMPFSQFEKPKKKKKKVPKRTRDSKFFFKPSSISSLADTCLSSAPRRPPLWPSKWRQHHSDGIPHRTGAAEEHHRGDLVPPKEETDQGSIPVPQEMVHPFLGPSFSISRDLVSSAFAIRCALPEQTINFNQQQHKESHCGTLNITSSFCSNDRLHFLRRVD